jgi:hypothetical protein
VEEHRLLPLGGDGVRGEGEQVARQALPQSLVVLRRLGLRQGDVLLDALAVAGRELGQHVLVRRGLGEGYHRRFDGGGLGLGGGWHKGLFLDGEL